jgi:hypothetical protein
LSESWGDLAITGEFGLGGSSFVPNYSAIYLSPLNYGVACQDTATGSGLLLHSAEDLCFAAERQICRSAAHPPGSAGHVYKYLSLLLPASNHLMVILIQQEKGRALWRATR